MPPFSILQNVLTFLCFTSAIRLQQPTANPDLFSPPTFAFGFQKTSLERTQIHPKQRCKTAGKEVGAGAEPPHAHTGSSASTQSSSQLRGIPSTDRRSITPKELEGTDGRKEGRKWGSQCRAREAGGNTGAELGVGCFPACFFSPFPRLFLSISPSFPPFSFPFSLLSSPPIS